MAISEQQINALVDRVVSSLATPETKSEAKAVPATVKTQPTMTDNAVHLARGCFNNIESAISAAEQAYLDYKRISVATRHKIIAAIRALCLENLNNFASMAIEETGLGRYDDKLKKNEVAIVKTPGVEDLEPVACSGDNGLTIFEQAPFGVIGSITPCTNPSETIISNAIGMIAGGNAVTFNPHPSAKKTSVFTVDLLNQAIISAGGPPNLVTTVVTPTIQSAQILMKHPKIALLVVTGGPAVVGVAMKSGKKVIAAGPGNPPVVVDETADIDKAARDIVMSASTDNNIICVIEKNIIVTKAAAKELKSALIKHGAVELSNYQARRLTEIIVDGDHPNKKWVGKDIQLILREINLDVDASKRLAFAEISADHPFATVELLLPVLPFIVVNDIDEAIEVAYKLEGGCFHTSVIHSRNIDHLHKMAVKMNTSIFVKNGPALAGLGLGGEGPASFTIASPTGEGVTTARHFTRTRRCVVSGHFRIV
ncbi:MAG: aldehyde dehydrogenase EutE [Gammaproteobacteria bacterium]|nr:aldehyde dehydrogenase EutE [Gammaproteobacteria bacterium]